jgi:hypothetical protein
MGLLRRWLGFSAARSLPVPHRVLRAVAALGIGPMTRDSLTMLEAGNCAPVESFVAALGFTPQPVAGAGPPPRNAG